MHKGQFSSTHLKNHLYYLGTSYNYIILYDIIIIIIIIIKKIINMFRFLRLITYMDEIPIIGVGY
jgi:hypothetical protein